MCICVGVKVRKYVYIQVHTFECNCCGGKLSLLNNLIVYHNTDGSKRLYTTVVPPLRVNGRSPMDEISICESQQNQFNGGQAKISF